MKRIRLALVIARLNVGGPATHVIELASRLPASEFDTRLITGSEGRHEASMHYLAEQSNVFPLVIPELSPVLGIWDWIALIKLVREFRRSKPDIVHTHTAKAGALGRIAARIAGVPVVVHTFHGHVLRGYFPKPVEELFRAVERALARISDRIVTLSPALREDLIDMRIAPAAKIEVIPLGMDLSAFEVRAQAREDLRRMLRIDDHGPLIGTVGRLVPIKNHSLFLRAARSMVDSGVQANFIIVGDGELRESLQTQAQDLGLSGRVFFLGWREDMAAVYGGLDLFALTSDSEGTPVSLIEAMAAGLPVVATAVGGVPDVVSDQVTGLLVPKGDEAALAAAWRMILADRAMARRMGERAREAAVEQFGRERMLDQMSALYRLTLAAKAAKR